MKHTFTDTLKQHKKTMTIGAAALIILGGGGYALSQSQGAKPEAAVETKAPAKKTTDKTAEKENAEKALLEAAEKKVAILEKNPVTENVKPAQEATDKVTDTDKKAAFQVRIDKAKAVIVAKEAEAKLLDEAKRLVKQAEDHQTLENVQTAQAANDKVVNEQLRGALQARINAVAKAIQAREAEAAAQAAAQAAAEQAAQAAADQAAQATASYEPTYEAPADGGTYAHTPDPGYTPSDHTQAVLSAPTDQDAVNISEGPDRPKDYSWAAGQ